MIDSQGRLLFNQPHMLQKPKWSKRCPDDVWERWAHAKCAELWQAVCLWANFDPGEMNGTALPQAPDSFNCRLRLALSYLEQIRPIHLDREKPHRSIVRLDYFRLWAKFFELPLPERFPLGGDPDDIGFPSGHPALQVSEVPSLLLLKAGATSKHADLQPLPERPRLQVQPREASDGVARAEPPAPTSRPSVSLETGPEFLTAEEVITLVRTSKATLYRWIKDGAFPGPTDLGGKRRLWSRAKLIEWQKSRLEPTATTGGNRTARRAGRV